MDLCWTVGWFSPRSFLKHFLSIFKFCSQRKTDLKSLGLVPETTVTKCRKTENWCLIWTSRARSSSTSLFFSESIRLSKKSSSLLLMSPSTSSISTSANGFASLYSFFFLIFQSFGWFSVCVFSSSLIFL